MAHRGDMPFFADTRFSCIWKVLIGSLSSVNVAVAVVVAVAVARAGLIQEN